MDAKSLGCAQMRSSRQLPAVTIWSVTATVHCEPTGACGTCSGWCCTCPRRSTSACSTTHTLPCASSGTVAPNLPAIAERRFMCARSSCMLSATTRPPLSSSSYDAAGAVIKPFSHTCCCRVLASVQYHSVRTRPHAPDHSPTQPSGGAHSSASGMLLRGGCLALAKTEAGSCTLEETMGENRASAIIVK